MTLYLDASALLKLYLDEPDAPACEAIMSGDRHWVSARHSRIEVRRNLARQIRGRLLGAARRQFEEDWRRVSVVELDAELCEAAARIAEEIGVRTLDALHLAASRRLPRRRLSFLTYDRRQADAARGLGLNVVGV